MSRPVAPKKRFDCATGAPWCRLVQFDDLPTEENVDALLKRIEPLVVQRAGDRRVFRAIIECIQNLERHAPRDLPARFVLSGRPLEGEPRFRIRSLNPIRQGDQIQVEQWVAQYAQLQSWACDALENDVMDWRSLYRNWLDNKGRTLRGGAGLGWVSLARLSIRPPRIRIVDSHGQANLYFSVEVRSSR